MIKKIFFLTVFSLAANYLRAQVIPVDGISSAGSFQIANYPGNFTGVYDGFTVIFRSNHTIPGAATMNIGGLGPKPIVNTTGATLIAGDIRISQVVTIIYDLANTRYQMITASGNAGGGGITGSGSTDYLPKFITGTSLGNSLISDNGTNVNVQGDNSDGAYKFAIGKNSSSVEKVLALTNSNAGDGVGTSLGFRSNFVGTTWDQARISGVTTNGISQGALVFETMKNRASSTMIEAMRITGDGFVGIGTSNPGSILHLASNGINYLTFENLVPASPYGIRLKSPDSDWYLISDIGGTPGKVGFYDASALLTRLVIDASGKVGIGTVNPNAKLQVVGKIRLGSETGTSELPSTPAGYTGLVIRRINSADSSLNQVLAVLGPGLTLERNGTRGALMIRAVAAGQWRVAVSNITSTGVLTGSTMSGSGTGTNIFGGSTMIKYGLSSETNGEYTEVSIVRLSNLDGTWVGTVTSTYDQ